MSLIPKRQRPWVFLSCYSSPFYGSMAYLDRNSEAIAQENMKPMTQQRLNAFYKKSNRLLANVLFYSDGVDES
ncbi:hypothetical protein DPSP01_010107 [Paraphaeosphaeria sporulosa]